MDIPVNLTDSRY